MTTWKLGRIWDYLGNNWNYKLPLICVCSQSQSSKQFNIVDRQSLTVLGAMIIDNIMINMIIWSINNQFDLTVKQPNQYFRNIIHTQYFGKPGWALNCCASWIFRIFMMNRIFQIWNFFRICRIIRTFRIFRQSSIFRILR